MKIHIALGKKLHTGLVAILAIFGMTGGLKAVVLNFDPLAYTSGATVIGQDGWRWMTSGGPSPNSIATVVATASAISSPNVMQVAGSIGDGTGNYGTLLNTGPDGLYAGTAGVITFYYQQVVAPATYAQSVSFLTDDGAATAMTFEFGTPQNVALPGRLGYYNGDANPEYTTTNIFGSGATGDWFKFTINFAASSYDLNVYNVTDSATALDLTGLEYRNGGTITKNVYGITVFAYDGTSFYDSISIAPVPEVSALNLLILGCLGLVFLRKSSLGHRRPC